MKILDIGCGKHKYKPERKTTVIGLDKHKLPGVDIVWDIEKGLPFQDNEFDIIICNHVLEHIHNFFFVMKEIHRVLKSNSTARIKVPYFSSDAAFTNPTHVRFFSYTTFEYLTDKFPENYYSKVRFEVVKRRLNWSFNPKFRSISSVINLFINFLPIVYQRLFAFILSCEELYVELKSVK